MLKNVPDAGNGAAPDTHPLTDAVIAQLVADTDTLLRSLVRGTRRTLGRLPTRGEIDALHRWHVRARLLDTQLGLALREGYELAANPAAEEWWEGFDALVPGADRLLAQALPAGIGDGDDC